MYRPTVLSARNIKELVPKLQLELDIIARIFEESAEAVLPVKSKEPAKFKEGSVVNFSEGVAVTGIPSTSAGLHIFRAGSWRKLAEV